jgi:DMSO/TMAO reductase YedYZ heme-binding membrane subunit
VDPQFMWWMSRASGMVAAVVLVSSLVLGVLVATRALRAIDSPAWVLAMHRWLSAMACLFVAIHLLTLVGDNYVYFGWKELFVVGGSAWKTAPVALGVVAMYLLVVVQGTSLLQRHLSRRWWKGLHYLGYLAVWLTSLHGSFAGTDASNRVYRAVAIVLTVVAVLAAVVRAVIGTTRHQAARKRALRERLEAEAEARQSNMA